MLYDQFFIDDLKDRADLVRIIEPYAPLKKKGANWMGCWLDAIVIALSKLLRVVRDT